MVPPQTAHYLVGPTSRSGTKITGGIPTVNVL
jgi:hypothetical protein